MTQATPPPLRKPRKPNIVAIVVAAVVLLLIGVISVQVMIERKEVQENHARTQDRIDQINAAIRRSDARVKEKCRHRAC